MRNCFFNFSALWAEVEPLAEAGFAALAMTPSHRWVAPAGGRQLQSSALVHHCLRLAGRARRTACTPFIFDFATSLRRRTARSSCTNGPCKAVPLGWGIDSDGTPTTDPAAILEGAMSTFGGHKGAALATMVELLGAALIGDLTSMESLAFDAGQGGAPMHGEIVIAFDPAGFAGPVGDDHLARAETVFGAITGQGLRLPSDRRYAARQRSLRDGVRVPMSLLDDIAAALGNPASARTDASPVA